MSKYSDKVIQRLERAIDELQREARTSKSKATTGILHKARRFKIKVAKRKATLNRAEAVTKLLRLQSAVVRLERENGGPFKF